MNLDKCIKDSVDALKNAEAIIVSAGAGMGVDSGLPDFRGTEGFWKAYPPIAKLGLSFSEMANPTWFEKEPTLAWGFYGHRLNLYRNTTPHKGFYILLEIVKNKNNNYFIFTSNVDGQFQKAGFDENKIYECHGSINYLQCVKNCTSEIWSASEISVVVNQTTFRAEQPLPKCKNCGSLARPNILMFGDWNWLSYRTDEQEIKLQEWLNENQKNSKLVVIEIGAGEGIPTVRRFSENMVYRYGAILIRINPIDCNVPDGCISIPTTALDGIVKIYNQIKIIEV